MTHALDQIVPWERSFEAYVEILIDSDLANMARIGRISMKRSPDTSAWPQRASVAHCRCPR